MTNLGLNESHPVPPYDDEDLQRAYERGRRDERAKARQALISVGRDHKQRTMARFLQAKGWKLGATKENGTEWADPSGAYRIGVPSDVTGAAWARTIFSLATYYRKSEKDISIEIMSYGRK